MTRRRVLAYASFALLAGPSRGRAQAMLESVRLAGVATEYGTNLYYAVKNGLFKRVGLDVEYVFTSSGTAATTGMIAGTYELGRTSLTAAFAAHLRGVAIEIVAPDSLYSPRSPFQGLQVAPDAPYKTGADFTGKTIGVPALSDLATLSTRAWVDKNSGDWRSLKYVEIPNSAMEAAIVAHRVDAGIMQLSQLGASVAAGRTRTVADPSSAIAPMFLAAAWAARTDWIARHTDLLRKLNRVLADAAAYVQAHPAETAPLVAELTKTPLADVAKMQRTVIAPNIDSSLVQPLIDSCAKYELIPQGFPARDILWNDRGGRSTSSG